MIIEAIKPYLCCPDDGRAVSICNGRIECPECGRNYSVLAENFIEMMPLQFPEWGLKDGEPKGCEQLYREEFHRKFDWKPKSSGWGDLSAASYGAKAFYHAQTLAICEKLTLRGTEIAIDVSGAVGNHSVAMSDRVRIVVNCDMHGPSILTAYQRRKENMMCVRVPYLRLPFSSGTFDYAICSDTLIRGRTHEVKLLREIIRILKPGGKAFVDFHNLKWARKNKNICAYKSDSIEKLLHEAGIKNYNIYPFGYVPLQLVFKEFMYPYLDSLFKFLLPPKRHIVVFTKTQD